MKQVTNLDQLMQRLQKRGNEMREGARIGMYNGERLNQREASHLHARASETFRIADEIYELIWELGPGHGGAT